jgi:hypothetical protein
LKGLFGFRSKENTVIQQAIVKELFFLKKDILKDINVKRELEGPDGRPLISRSSEDSAQRLLLMDLLLNGGIHVKFFHVAT